MQPQPMLVQPPQLNRPFPQHLAPHFAQMGVPMDQVMNYWSTFNHFDQDGSGTISAAEMATGLQLMGQCVTPHDVQNMMMQADHNRDGQVDFVEYVRVSHSRMQPQQAVQHDLEAAFRVFDKDGSGYIDSNELKAVLCHKGMDKNDFDRVMARVDLDGDGRLNYHEFANLMTQPLGSMGHSKSSGQHHDKHSKKKDKKKKKKKSKKSKKGGSDGSDGSGYSDYSGGSDCSGDSD